MELQLPVVWLSAAKCASQWTSISSQSCAFVHQSNQGQMLCRDLFQQHGPGHAAEEVPERFHSCSPRSVCWGGQAVNLPLRQLFISTEIPEALCCALPGCRGSRSLAVAVKCCHVKSARFWFMFYCFWTTCFSRETHASLLTSSPKRQSSC